MRRFVGFSVVALLGLILGSLAFPWIPGTQQQQLRDFNDALTRFLHDNANIDFLPFTDADDAPGITQGTATPTPRSGPALAPTPTPTIPLEAQLPRDVFEDFHDSFYGNCSEPPFDSLGISKSWSGSAGEAIDFVPPGGTYFLVLIGTPLDAAWHFDSILKASRDQRFQSLRIDSGVPDSTTDAQKWCTTSTGFPDSDTLEIDASNISWTVFLIAPQQSWSMPRDVSEALEGYYGACPTPPEIEQLKADVIATSLIGGANQSVNFTGPAPYYYLGVQFEPDERDWSFESVSVSGNRRVAGPSVSSASGERIDFTATCPASTDAHHLEISASGGGWTVYLVTVAR